MWRRKSIVFVAFAGLWLAGCRDARDVDQIDALRQRLAKVEEENRLLRGEFDRRTRAAEDRLKSPDADAAAVARTAVKERDEAVRKRDEALAQLAARDEDTAALRKKVQQAEDAFKARTDDSDKLKAQVKAMQEKAVETMKQQDDIRRKLAETTDALRAAQDELTRLRESGTR